MKAHPEVKNWDDVGSIVLKQAKRYLIEPEVLKNIEMLKSNNVLVFAITAMNKGRYGLIPRLEDWRYEHLKSLGFEGSFSKLEFPLDLDKSQLRRHPIFHHGLISTDLEAKGPVFDEFIEQLMKIEPSLKKPVQVVMFDDDVSQLRSVAQICHNLQIPFKGYRYLGAKTKKWNKELVNFQADYLIMHRVWLGDTEAKTLMDNHKQ